MRSYNLRLSDEYGISNHRYRELKEFCSQYREKKDKLGQIYTSSCAGPEVTVKGGLPGKPTEQKAMRATRLKEELKVIDDTLKNACGDDVGVLMYLKKNVTEGIGYSQLGIVPCGQRSFYNYRRKFFFLLDKVKKG